MTLPTRVRAEVEARLGPVVATRPVGGGCINPAVRLELAGGPVFLKYNLDARPGAFGVEAEALGRLRDAGTELRVPAVLAARDATGDDPVGWLALEWLEPAHAGPDPELLGRGLAALHRAPATGWGWERDGFLGPLPQPNVPTSSWGEFWAARRLEPLLRRAYQAGHRPGSGGEWERLLTALPALLATAETDGPSLLHGDLWSGNVLGLAEGGWALVDPAAYRGHREVDLAMSELFGGFAPGFLGAYRAAWPLRPGYAEVRRPVYQLYYLLAHLILFGSGYLDATVACLRRALAAS